VRRPIQWVAITVVTVFVVVSGSAWAPASSSPPPRSSAPSIIHAVLGYPWANASYVDANYDWGYTTCPTNDPNCFALSGIGPGNVRYGEGPVAVLPPKLHFLRGMEADMPGRPRVGGRGSRQRQSGTTMRPQRA
jgi:hypothetical protein